MTCRTGAERCGSLPADQPEIFLHRVLKQTQSYLAKGCAAEAQQVQKELQQIAGLEADRGRISIDEESRKFDL